MGRQKKSESSFYANYEEFLAKHPNPMREARDEPEVEDRILGKQLAQRFLNELTTRLKMGTTDGV